MKINEITPVTGETVTTDESEFNEYVRYGANCWYVRMGESDEPVYECNELEQAYQEHKRGST